MINKFLVLITFILSMLIPGCGENEKPPAPGIVATFQGGQISGKDVNEYLNKLVQGTDPEALKQFRRKDVYKSIIRTLALDHMIQEKVKEKKLDKKENVKHVMKHISEEMNIEELHNRAHKGKIRVSETDIRRYYEENRKQYGDKSLTEVKDEIQNILQAEKENDYFRNYIEELKKNAVITRQHRLLKVPGPTEAELRLYYEENRNEYNSPARSFSDVKGRIIETLRKRKEKEWFKQNRNRTLFTIHGKRYTAGEFYQEFEELSLQERNKYQGDEGLKTLMDRMIERLLVVEDTYDQMLNTENREERKHMQDDVLSQLLHQEEVDDKLEISEEEIKAYYDNHKNEFADPPQVKISYIRIYGGQTKDEKERAGKKIEEAHRKVKPWFWKKWEPFENVALEYSEDSETSEEGGEIDEWISESSNLFDEIAMHTFHEIVLGLAKDEISPPFYFQGSYYIVKVRERKEPRPLALEEVREAIKAELSAKKHEELTHNMGNTLLEKANLVIYDGEIRAMLDEDKNSDSDIKQ